VTFDESNAAITEQFTDKKIEFVVRNGKVLEFHTECGHVIKLQTDVKGDIHFRGTDVRIILPTPMPGVGVLGFLNTGH
jgi:hypothetical protein